MVRQRLNPDLGDKCRAAWLCRFCHKWRFSDESLLFAELPVLQLANSCSGTRLPRSWFIPINWLSSYKHPNPVFQRRQKGTQANASSYFQISNPSSTPTGRLHQHSECSSVTQLEGGQNIALGYCTFQSTTSDHLPRVITDFRIDKVLCDYKNSTITEGNYLG